MKDQVTSIEQPLRLVDGKFMLGDIKPEIGNPKQLALLQKIERERTQREKDANGRGRGKTVEAIAAEINRTNNLKRQE